MIASLHWLTQALLEGLSGSGLVVGIGEYELMLS